MHPSGTSSLSDHVVLDDRLHPVPGIWVGEINHGEADTQTVDEIDLTILILDKVAVFAALRELVLSDVGNLAGILDIRIDIDERSDTILGPVVNHVIPIVVPIGLELPVPDQTSAFRVCEFANPVLHPDADHGQL